MSSVAHIIRRRRNRKARQRLSRGRNRLWSGFIASLFAFAILLPLSVTLGIAGWLYAQALSTMPTAAETIYLDPIIGTTQFTDSSGQTVLFSVRDPLGDTRDWLEIAQLPPYLLHATIQMEDPNFLSDTPEGDFLSDTTGTLGRVWRYILAMPSRRDSSLTARLARNALIPLASNSGLDPALLEIAYIADINRRYTPLEVLEWHLNTNFYGNDAYGIEAAAQVYLDKSAVDLTLDEAALLAAIPPAPQFNPLDNENAARGRQLDLLRNMLVNGTITQDDFNFAASRLTPLRTDSRYAAQIAPEFSQYAREQAEDILTWIGLDGPSLVARGGLQITTTLDLDLYYQSDCLLRAHLAQLRGQSSAAIAAQTGEPCAALAYLDAPSPIDPAALPDSGALLLMDVATGEIKSLVGDVTSQTRQPGPTLHPFVYFQGFLTNLYNPASMVLDIPQPFPGAADGLIYTPNNPDRRFRGPVNLRDAMVGQLLPPVVAVADDVRLNNVIASAHLIGLNSLDRTEYDLSLLERGGSVSVLDITYAYSVFATLGVQQGVDTEPLARNYRARNPVAIKRIADAEGNILWQYDADRIALSKTNIFEPELGYLVNDVLADNLQRQAVLETDTNMLNINRPAAVVNGLTSDDMDNWTIGYTPQYVLGVHLGRDDRRALSLDTHGLQGAAYVWQAIMRYAHERDALPPAQWSQPDGIERYVICERSGLIPPNNSQCPTRTEIFAAPPLRTDTYWQAVEVNSQTNQRATTYTPASLRIERVYFVPPAPALDWWQANGQPLPPTEYDTRSRPAVLTIARIFSPGEYDYLSGVVDVRGAIDTDTIQFYQLAYGQGLNPTQWFDITGRQTTRPNTQLLGEWNTNGLDGIYTLQLSVTLPDNSIDNDFVQVTIDNQIPSVRLNAGEAGRIYRFPAENIIPINAEASDNLGVERVEFYRNGILLGIDREYPYGFEFDIQRTGTETFRAVVFDRVGNQSSDELAVEIIRSQ